MKAMSNTKTTEGYAFQVTLYAEPGLNLRESYKQVREALASVELGWETERAYTPKGHNVAEEALQEAIVAVLDSEEAE